MKLYAVIACALLLICGVQAQSGSCPSICPAIYAPVCGFNGTCYRNFSSDCDMASAACTERGKGFRRVGLDQCLSAQTPKC